MAALHEAAADRHLEGEVLVRHVHRRAEPRVERVPVDLRLDAREDFVPEIHLRRRHASFDRFSRRFSTVFSTGVENSGDRPKLHGFAAGRIGSEKDADCNTIGFALTLSPAVR